jgi:heat shock protein HspQ
MGRPTAGQLLQVSPHRRDVWATPAKKLKHNSQNLLSESASGENTRKKSGNSSVPDFGVQRISRYISIAMNKTREAKYQIGQVVKHRVFPFRGVVFDIDPTFSNTEEWYQSIPADVRPNKDQPFYHLYAENSESQYVAYVSEQNLLPDPSGDPVQHPQVSEVFKRDERGNYRLRSNRMH